LKKFALCLLTLLLVGLEPGIASAATSRDLIQGTGSSWAALAVQQWIADTTKIGLKVSYTDPGSAQGRKDFAAGNTDFGVSDIGYQGNDPRTGENDSSSRAYAYLPIVGGGTAFPYNITVAGKRITNLRLSGQTIAKIFTNHISNWNDPQITKDNNGNALPSIPIVPVVHSEGAGTTAMFTRYLAKMFPNIWGPFSGGQAAMTEYFQPQAPQVAAYGSDGVMNVITGNAGQGTIGYNEYAYALAAGVPVVKVENAAGYYTLPTQYNDAVALTQAQINLDKSSPDYLLQNLDGVYTYTDPRAYALSSYSYGIIPTAANDVKMTTAKRQTLADYLFYAVCSGQVHIGNIGYSALPLNLVQASFDQIAKLNAADPGVDLSQQSPQNCGNPTFDPANPATNHLAAIDPAPSACDKDGAGPCTDDTSKGTQNQTPTPTPSGSKTGSKPGSKPSATKSASPSQGGGTRTNQTLPSSGVTGGTAPSPAGSTPSADTSASVDPYTGETQPADNTADMGSATPAAAEIAETQRQGSAVPYAVVAVLFLLLIIAAPPLVVSHIRRGRR
jgi:ABC-type phosphate transport system substrate-binding protein